MSKQFQKYHLSECIESEGTIWVIERTAPNSGEVVLETKNKYKAFDILNNLNNKSSDCNEIRCGSYDKTAEFNCGINNFTFGISFCRCYMFEPEEPVINPFGEECFLMKIDGGVTECCFADNPCDIHKEWKRNKYKQQEESDE